MNDTKEAIVSFPPDPICKSSDPWYENESPRAGRGQDHNSTAILPRKKTV